MQGIINKCYVHLERLPEHIITKCSVKADMKYLFSSEKTLKDIYNDNVSLLCLGLIKEIYVMNIGIYLQTVLNSRYIAATL